MKGIKVGLLVGIAVLLWGGVAAASGLGLGARYTWVRTIDTHKNTSMLGVLGRLRGSNIGVEAAVDYRKDDLGGGYSVKTWPVTGSLLIYPFQSIYGLAGLGWYNVTLGVPAGVSNPDKTKTRLGYHLGAGVELPVTPGMKVAGEFRYIFLDYKFENIPGEVGKRKADNFTLGAAVLFYL